MKRVVGRVEPARARLFFSPNDPRMLSTLDAINRSSKDCGLLSDGLVNRYDSETAERQQDPDGRV